MIICVDVKEACYKGWNSFVTMILTEDERDIKCFTDR